MTPEEQSNMIRTLGVGYSVIGGLPLDLKVTMTGAISDAYKKLSMKVDWLPARWFNQIFPLNGKDLGDGTFGIITPGAPHLVEFVAGHDDRILIWSTLSRAVSDLRNAMTDPWRNVEAKKAAAAQFTAKVNEMLYQIALIVSAPVRFVEAQSKNFLTSSTFTLLAVAGIVYIVITRMKKS